MLKKITGQISWGQYAYWKYLEIFQVGVYGYVQMLPNTLHDFAHKQDSQLNSSVLITVWRVVIEKSVTGLPTK